MKFTLSALLSLFLLLCFSATPVFADDSTAGEGNLMYIFTMPDGTGFFKVELHEKNGNYDGQISSSGGFGGVQGRFIGDALAVSLGNMYHFNLKYQMSTDKRTKREYLRGFYTENRPIEIKTYTDLKKGSLRMDMALDNNKADYVSDGKEFRLNWSEKNNNTGQENLFTLWGNKIKNEPGSCEGALSPQDNPMTKLMYFYCESSGSLENSFFRRTIDLIAWVIPYLM